jgi:hypothetical protein
VATIPGEWQEGALASLRDRLFSGNVDETTRRRTSLFSKSPPRPKISKHSENPSRTAPP